MNKLILVILALCFAGNAQAAILCESLNGGSPYIPASLSVAATSNSCRNTNVVVTSALSAVQSNISSATLHAWPADRALKVEKGGSIANSTQFTINGPFSAGGYQVFTGSGRVLFGNGIVDKTIPQWFGTNTTPGVTDMTTAFQKAIDSLPANGGLVYVANGTYLLTTIEFPVQPKTVNLIGESMKTVILKMGTAAGPILKKKAVEGVIFGGILSNFTIQAHPSSDKTNLTHQGAFLSGWYHSKFSNIAYQSSSNSQNPSGSVGIFLNLTGSPYASYNNTFEGIEVIGQYGPSRAINLGNNGTTVFNNPNVVAVRDSTFYANTGIDVLIQGDVSGMMVSNCLFESNPGTTAVIMGQNSLIEGNWFEANLYNVTTSSLATVDGSGSTVMNNYMSDGTNHIDTIGRKPLWINNSGQYSSVITGSGVTQIDSDGETPAGPALTGWSGTPTKLYSASVSPIYMARVAYKTAYSYVPTATGLASFTISPIPGYVLESCIVTCTRNTTGMPELVGVNISTSTISINYITTDAHTIYMQSVWRRL